MTAPLANVGSAADLKRSGGNRSAAHSALVKACLDYLALRGTVHCWRAKVGATFDKGKMIYRKPDKYSGRGVPDIIGFEKRDGRFIGIECKTGDATLNPEQREFRDIAECCRWVVVRSVGELDAAMEAWGL